MDTAWIGLSCLCFVLGVFAGGVGFLLIAVFVAAGGGDGDIGRVRDSAKEGGLNERS